MCNYIIEQVSTVNVVQIIIETDNVKPSTFYGFCNIKKEQKCIYYPYL